MNVRQSGMGITSFALAIVVGIAMFVLFGVAGVIEATTPGGMAEDSAEAVLIGLGIFALAGLDLVALGLGVATMFQKESRKSFGILGMVFSVAVVAVTAGIIALGLMMG